jgi:hypothetical protein
MACAAGRKPDTVGERLLPDLGPQEQAPTYLYARDHAIAPDHGGGQKYGARGEVARANPEDDP